MEQHIIYSFLTFLWSLIWKTIYSNQNYPFLHFAGFSSKHLCSTCWRKVSMDCVVMKILAVREVEGFFGVCGIGFSDDVVIYKCRTRSWGHLKGERPSNPFPPPSSPAPSCAGSCRCCPLVFHGDCNWWSLVSWAYWSWPVMLFSLSFFHSMALSGKLKLTNWCCHVNLNIIVIKKLVVKHA